MTDLRISVEDNSGRKLGGTAYSGTTPTIVLRISPQVTREDLANDWVLVHELSHLAFPPMRRRHSWIEEGFATYVEPIIRVRAGLQDEKNAWKWMLEGMPHGLPVAGDQGLDNTRTWGRTYWGGALYFLLADIQIRKQTNNKQGLGDALREIKNAGGTMQQTGTWPITKALKAGDSATDINALMDVYDTHKNNAVMTDLELIWKRLGVALINGQIVFDDTAPEAALRMAIFSRK